MVKKGAVQSSTRAVLRWLVYARATRWVRYAGERAGRWWATLLRCAAALRQGLPLGHSTPPPGLRDCSARRRDRPAGPGPTTKNFGQISSFSFFFFEYLEFFLSCPQRFTSIDNSSVLRGGL